MSRKRTTKTPSPVSMPPVGKTADRPHRITIRLAFVPVITTLLLGVISFYFVRRSAQVAENSKNIADAVNRPYFEFLELVTHPGAEQRDDYPFDLKVRNIGKLSTRDLKLSVAFYASPFIDGRMLRKPTLVAPAPRPIAPGEVAEWNISLIKRDFKAIWPGWAKLNDPEMPQGPARINLVIGGSITYKGEVTERTYTQYWCFHSPEEIFDQSYRKCSPSTIDLMALQ